MLKYDIVKQNRMLRRMESMYKLIVTDMDGTFLNSYGNIPHGNLNAVIEAQKRGVQFAIVTGRPYSAVKRLLRTNNLKCAVIGCNGAQVTDSKGRLIRSHYIKKESLLKIMRLAQDRDIYYQIYDDTSIYTRSLVQAVKMIRHFSNKAVKMHFSYRSILGGLKRIFFAELRLKPDIITFASDKRRQFYKVQIASLKQEELLRLKKDLLDVDGISITSSNYFNLEIGPKGVTKGTALCELSEEMGIPKEDIIAMGDNLNDIPMIEFAGCGVAVGNAEDAVKEKADFITKTNDELGVGYAIRKFVFKED